MEKVQFLRLKNMSVAGSQPRTSGCCFSQLGRVSKATLMMEALRQAQAESTIQLESPKREAKLELP